MTVIKRACDFIRRVTKRNAHQHGRLEVSDGKPHEDAKTGLIAYTDANGTKQQINTSVVKSMIEIGHCPGLLISSLTVRSVP
ncbi:Conserved uncharacterized protein (plasmid) [Erwinia billingiae Eb661]|uniref:Conserved uncharacterized protein n=1 Tax=Erwinia billingiae (strain Eb661) TaxID=634500 RepID=D8MJN2_ERWBE|nr:Conserved uncharacterized protein [Erwinia billingiae Eb661]